MDNWTTDICECRDQYHPNALILRYTQNYRERDYSAFLFPAEGLLLLAACNRDQGNTDSHTVLELYDTSAGDPGKLQCMFALPSRLNGRSSVEVYSGDSYHYNPSTFYTRPEDRILTIFVEEVSEPYQQQYPNHITLIVVFISTLLRISKSRRFIAWEEWKQHAWVADQQEADDLFKYGAFISSSRIIHFSIPMKEQGAMALEVTSFRPSMIERLFHVPGDTPDDLREGVPRRLVGRKVLLDMQVDDDDNTEVMMTEDNIVLMTVRRSVR